MDLHDHYQKVTGNRYEGDEPLAVHLPTLAMEHAPTLAGLAAGGYAAYRHMTPRTVPAEILAKFPDAGKPGGALGAMINGAIGYSFGKNMTESYTKGLDQDLRTGDGHHNRVQRLIYEHMPGTEDPSNPGAHFAGNVAAGTLSAGVPLAGGIAALTAARHLLPVVAAKVGDKTPAGKVLDTISHSVLVDKILSMAKSPKVIGGALGFGALSGAARAYGQHHRQEEVKMATLSDPFSAFMEKVASGWGFSSRNDDGSYVDESAEKGVYFTPEIRQHLGVTDHSLNAMSNDEYLGHAEKALEHDLARGKSEAEKTNAIHSLHIEHMGDEANFDTDRQAAIGLMRRGLEDNTRFHTVHRFHYPTDHPVSRRAEALMKEYGGKVAESEYDAVDYHPGRQATHRLGGAVIGAGLGLAGGAAMFGRSALKEPTALAGTAILGASLGGMIGGAIKRKSPTETTKTVKRKSRTTFDHEHAFSIAKSEHEGEDPWYNLDAFKKAADTMSNSFHDPYDALMQKLALNFHEDSRWTDEETKRKADNSWQRDRYEDGIVLAPFARRQLESKYGPTWKTEATMRDVSGQAMSTLKAHLAHGGHNLKSDPIPGTRYDIGVKNYHGDLALLGKNEPLTQELLNEGIHGDFGEYQTLHRTMFPHYHRIAQEATHLHDTYGGQSYDDERVREAYDRQRGMEGTLIGGLAGGALGAISRNPMIMAAGIVGGGMLGHHIGNKMTQHVPEHRWTETTHFDEARALDQALNPERFDDTHRFEKKTAYQLYLDKQAGLPSKAQMRDAFGKLQEAATINLAIAQQHGGQAYAAAADAVKNETWARAALGGATGGGMSIINQKSEGGDVNPWRVARGAAVGATVGATAHRIGQAWGDVKGFLGDTREAYKQIPGLRQDINTAAGQVRDDLATLGGKVEGVAKTVQGNPAGSMWRIFKSRKGMPADA